MAASELARRILEVSVIDYDDGSTKYMLSNPNDDIIELYPFKSMPSGHYFKPHHVGLDHDEVPFTTDAALTPILLCIAITVLLLLIGAISSGLNVSLLSIDTLKIKMMRRSKKPFDKKVVQRLEPLLSNRHLLLVTILVLNTSAMESLPLFLNIIFPSWASVILSVSFVLLFCEIIPQAVLSSNPIKAGYQFAWLVEIAMIIFYPVCKPIAMLLDRVVTDRQSTVLFSRDEMKTLFDFIRLDHSFATTREQFLADELTVIDGALKLGTTMVSMAMTEWSNVKLVPSDLILDQNGLQWIYQLGKSRIPVYAGRVNNIIGLLLVKDLLGIDPTQCRTVREFIKRKPIILSPKATISEALNRFRVNHTHLAIVTRDIKRALICMDGDLITPEDTILDGIVTLEDIMEQLLQTEINDEFDVKTPLNMAIPSSGLSHKTPRDTISVYTHSSYADSTVTTDSHSQHCNSEAQTLLSDRIVPLAYQTFENEPHS